MGQLIIVIEEGEIYLLRVGLMPHCYHSIELQLAIFDDINVLCQFFPILFLILRLQIDLLVSIDIV